MQQREKENTHQKKIWSFLNWYQHSYGNFAKWERDLEQQKPEPNLIWQSYFHSTRLLYDLV